VAGCAVAAKAALGMAAAPAIREESTVCNGQVEDGLDQGITEC